MQLLYYIDIMKRQGKNFHKINQMSININSDICNMTDDYAKYSLFVSNPIERRINIIFGKSPELLNQISNNILVKKNLI